MPSILELLLERHADPHPSGTPPALSQQHDIRIREEGLQIIRSKGKETVRAEGTSFPDRHVQAGDEQANPLRVEKGEGRGGRTFFWD